LWHTRAPRLLDGRLQLIAAALTANDKMVLGGDHFKVLALYMIDRNSILESGSVHVGTSSRFTLHLHQTDPRTRTTVGAGYRLFRINVGGQPMKLNTDMPTSNGS